jgi:trigger factor
VKEIIRENFVKQFAPESDYKFIIDAKQALEDKAKDIQFPDEFLKRWLVASDAKSTAETIEDDYPKICADLKFHLIKEQIVKENDIKVTREDIEQQAYVFVRKQFAQYYGMDNVPDYLVENHVQGMLKKQDNTQVFFNQAQETKLIALFKEQVSLEYTDITFEEFIKLFEKQENDN